ncbi:MAG: MBL fold metallo-hydrolase [Pirellulaceae bacterium]|nr:MBL fold metallo-hydrolase [Pirellulaceae bacterium]MDP6718870.1 MBL fold metallo-hydrolase [Pirellulaceae bacterium]
MEHLEVELAVIVSDLFAENCFVANLKGKSEAIVVDPGFSHERILDYLVDKQLTPVALLNTHGHADHIGGNSEIKRKWPTCPLVIGAGDSAKLADPVQNLSRGHGVDIVSPRADQLVTEGETVSAAGFDLEVLETPGHSVGHVVFLLKDHAPWLVFGGDVLFQGSIGRFDFPDGDENQLLESIRSKLYVLPDETIVLPGHGGSTSIGDEKRSNPYVRG